MSKEVDKTLGNPPNAYAAFEFTRDNTFLLKKILQLERGLTVLLERSREKNGDLQIGQIVRFVGIATPEVKPEELIKHLLDNLVQLPLVSALCALGRFICARIPSMDEISAMKMMFDVSLGLTAVNKRLDAMDQRLDGMATMLQQVLEKLK
jgi:hypothetical protein